MKIFFIGYTDAGIHEPRGTKIASSLSRMGHEIVWLYCEGNGSAKIPGVTLRKIVVPKIPFRLREMAFAFKAAKWIAENKENFEVGIGFSHIGGLACYAAFRKTGLPFVFDYPDPLYPSDEAYASFYSRSDKWLARVFEEVESKALNSASAVAAISPYFRSFVHEKYGVPLGKIFVAPNAPDCSAFKPSSRKYKVFTIAYSGKGIPEYGLDWLLQCFAKCKGKARLLLVVKTEPSWRKWLFGEVERLGLAGKVEIVENVPPETVARLLSKAHAAAFPYPRGKINDYAAPNKFFEYLALGLPVISRETPESKRILTEGKCGFIASDARGFCNAVESLSKNRLLEKRTGANARKLALEKYDWKRISREYEKKLGQAIFSEGFSKTPSQPKTGLKPRTASGRKAFPRTPRSRPRPAGRSRKRK
ncbi:MAG: glycosyltransferase family 4 protein [Candidatus Micrarchaeota archaeon]